MAQLAVLCAHASGVAVLFVLVKIPSHSSKTRCLRPHAYCDPVLPVQYMRRREGAHALKYHVNTVQKSQAVKENAV